MWGVYACVCVLERKSVIVCAREKEQVCLFVRKREKEKRFLSPRKFSSLSFNSELTQSLSRTRNTFFSASFLSLFRLSTLIKADNLGNFWL